MIHTAAIDVVWMVMGNLFSLAVYAGLLSKLVSERLQNGDDVSALVLTYSVLTQLAIILLRATALTTVCLFHNNRKKGAHT